MRYASSLSPARAALAIAVASVVLLAPPARAERAQLRYDVGDDVALTAASLLAAGVMTAMKQDLAPLTCRWCAPGSLDAEVRASLRWNDTHAADLSSTVIDVGAIPVASLAFLLVSAWASGDAREGLADVLLVAEAASAALVLSEGLKYAVGRSRPWAHFGSASGSADANLSFPSGHTTFAFAVVAASATVAWLRDYPGATVLTIAGAASAALVGYLRVAADQHYLVDVLAGSALGTLVGVAIPLLLHRRLQGPARAGTLRPAPGGVAVVF